MTKSNFDWGFFVDSPGKIIGWSIFFISQLTMLVWIILKFLGIINTPLWQELMPFMSFLLSWVGIFLPLALMLGNMKGDVLVIKRDIDSVQQRVEKIEKDVCEIKDELRELRHDFNLHVAKYHS